MNADDIKKYCRENLSSSVLSYPNRGPWGNSQYRGNCTGWVHAAINTMYDVKKMAELFAGGGTGSDVCRDMGIQYIGADLNPNPVRNNILVVDAIADEVPEEFLDADMFFMHPPYGAEIHIPYAGNMYADPTGMLSKHDLGQMEWHKFMQTLNGVVMKYYAAMPANGKMAILMGNIRRNGHFHSMIDDIVKPGETIARLVKTQHNCVSDGRRYSGNTSFMTTHEDIIVVRKPGGYYIFFKTPVAKTLDIRNSQQATWRDVVRTALSVLGGKASLDAIYDAVNGVNGGSEKCKANPHWKEKVRQTLQKGFYSPQRGVWALAA